MRCPHHRVPLVLDERTTESVPDGLAPLGVERSCVVERWACPAAGCRHAEERTMEARR